MKKIIILSLSILFFLSTIIYAEPAKYAKNNSPGHEYYKIASQFLTDKDYVNAFKNFKKAADMGNSQAQYTMSHFYITGQVVEKNLKTAFNWAKKSAEQNNLHGQLLLCKMLLNGHGVKRDFVEGFKWGKKAAELGHYEAQYITGLLYTKGIGTKKDIERGKFWFIESAKRGYSLAMYHLGRLVSSENQKKSYSEIINSCDNTISTVWIDSAAYLGLPDAQFYKCIMYSDLLGSPEKFPKGYGWCKVYVDNRNISKKNYDYAKKQIDELLKRFSVFQKNKGEQVYHGIKNKLSSYVFEYSKVKSKIDECEKRLKNNPPNNRITFDFSESFKQKKIKIRKIDKEVINKQFNLASELRKHLDSNDLKSMIKTISQMESSPLKDKFLALIIAGLLYKDKTDIAFKISENIDDSEEKSTSVELIINNLLEKNRPDYATKISESINDKEIKEKVLNLIFDYFIKKRSVKQALSILDKSDFKDKDYKKIQIKVISYLEKNNIKEALNVIKNNNAISDIENLKVLVINHLIENKKFDSAKKIIETLERETTRSLMYASIVKKYYTLGMFEEFSDTLYSISDDDIHFDTIKKLALKNALKNDIEKTMSFIEKLRSQKDAETIKKKIFILMSLNDQKDKASAILSKITKKDDREEVFKKLSEVFSKRGDIEKTKKYLDKINNKRLEDEVNLILAEAYSNSGKIEELRLILSKTDLNKKIENKVKSEILIINCLKKIGDLNKTNASIKNTLKLLNEIKVVDTIRYPFYLYSILDQTGSDKELYKILKNSAIVFPDQIKREDMLVTIMLHKNFKDYFKELFLEGSSYTRYKKYNVKVFNYIRGFK